MTSWILNQFKKKGLSVNNRKHSEKLRCFSSNQNTLISYFITKISYQTVHFYRTNHLMGMVDSWYAHFASNFIRFEKVSTIDSLKLLLIIYLHFQQNQEFGFILFCFDNFSSKLNSGGMNSRKNETIKIIYQSLKSQKNSVLSWNIFVLHGRIGWGCWIPFRTLSYTWDGTFCL